jgi:hypothetical protein
MDPLIVQGGGDGVEAPRKFFVSPVYRLGGELGIAANGLLGPEMMNASRL